MIYLHKGLQMKRCKRSKIHKHQDHFKEVNICIDCRREMNIARDRSVVGMIKIIYQSQKTNSIQRSHHLPDYTIEELLVFYNQNDNGLHKRWVESGYDKDLKPSVDRIDSELSYTLDNIEMMTWAENNAKGRTERHKRVMQITRLGEVIGVFDSIKDASAETGIPASTIHYGCNNDKKKTFGQSKFKWKYV